MCVCVGGCGGVCVGVLWRCGCVMVVCVWVFVFCQILASTYCTDYYNVPHKLKTNYVCALQINYKLLRFPFEKSCRNKQTTNSLSRGGFKEKGPVSSLLWDPSAAKILILVDLK